MIYVECKPDEILVRSLTNLPGKEIIHEIKGKSELVRRVSRARNARGLVDEDPLSAPPVYLKRMRVLQDLPGRGLKLLNDSVLNNNIIVLCPRLEEWIARAADEIRADLSGYNLPRDPKKLHEVVNLDLRKFERLVTDLTRSERLISLRALLTS